MVNADCGAGVGTAQEEALPASSVPTDSKPSAYLGHRDTLRCLFPATRRGFILPFSSAGVPVTTANRVPLSHTL